jgi:hypothetical protein
MPKLPFIFSRETEYNAIDSYVRDPAKRLLLRQMVDAVLRVRETGAVTPAELTPILAGFEAKNESVWSNAAGWLAKLQGFAPELAPALEELSRHPSAAVRFRLCASLDRFPPEVAVPHLRTLLADRSARVRGTAVNVAVSQGWHQLIPDLEARLAQERNAERRLDLQQAIALLQGKTFTHGNTQVRKLPGGDLEFSSTN